MSEQPFPPGWDEQRVRQVIAHYDNLTEDELLAEHEAALAQENQTVMVVPTDLVPEILQLIAKRHPA